MTGPALLLALLAAVGEDPVATLTVNGMKSAETCGAAVTAKLAAVEAVASAKLLDFKAGTFRLAFKAGTSIDPSKLRGSVEPRYELARIEATLAGELALDEDKLYLLMPSGWKCHLNGSCAEKPDPVTKVRAEVEAKLRAWLAAKKTAVRITGDLEESCCEGEDLLSTLKAELSPPP